MQDTRPVVLSASGSGTAERMHFARASLFSYLVLPHPAPDDPCGGPCAVGCLDIIGRYEYHLCVSRKTGLAARSNWNTKRGPLEKKNG